MPGSTARIASSIEVAPTAANSAVSIGRSHDAGTNDAGATRPFERHVPAYLPGVYTGVGLMLVLLLVAVMRLRRAMHRHFDSYGT